MKFLSFLFVALVTGLLPCIANAEPGASPAGSVSDAAMLPPLKLDATGRISEWLFQPGTSVAVGPVEKNWEVVRTPFLWTAPGDRLKKPEGRPAAPWVGSKTLADADSGWFERVVSIPANWSGQRIWINFDQVECDGLLWIDGQGPTYIEGPSARLDVTGMVRPGHDVNVRVWVTRWWKDIPKTADQDPLRKAVLFGKGEERKGDELRRKIPAGISSYVYFENRPLKGELTSAFARTSWREKALNVDVDGIVAPELKGARLRVEISDPKGGPVPAPRETAVAWSGEGKQSIQIPWARPHFWELGDGYLYDLKVTLLDAQGRSVHALTPVRFGFREIWVAGRDIIMNGHPIHLRQAPVIDVQWPSLLFWKGIGFNALEWHPNDSSWFTTSGRRSLIIDPKDNPSMRGIGAEVLDKADELGMALLMPAPNVSRIGDGLLQPDATWAYRREAKSWFAKIKNHPSIIMWLPAMNTGSFTRENPERVGTNPTSEERFGDWYEHVYKLIREEDPSRLITCHDGHVGEVDLPNQYLNFMPLQERIEFPSQWAKQGDRPWGAIEHGTPFLANFLKWNNVPLFTEYHAIYFGDRAYERETDDYVRQIQTSMARKPKSIFAAMHSDELAKLGTMTIHDEWEHLFTTETNRAWRAFGVPGGWKPWNFDIGMGIPPELVGKKVGNFFYSELTEEEARATLATPPPWANAVYRSYRETMGPLLSFVGGPVSRFTAKDHEYFSGEPFEKSIIVIWDGYQDRRLVAEWSLAIHGAPVQSGTEALALTPGEIVKQPLSFKAPEVAARTDAQLQLKVKNAESGEVLQQDQMALTFWPKPKSDVALQSRWALYDPAKRSQKWLQSLGVNATPVNDREGWKQAKANVLVVGREGMGKSLPFTADDVKSGLRVLLLEQTPSALESVGLRIQDIVSRYTFVRDRQSPILAGLGDGDLINWRGEPDLLPKTSLGMKRWPLARPPHWGNYGAVSSVVIETPHYGAFTPILEAEFDLAYTPLLEWRHGAGGVLFSTLDLSQRVEAEPAATAIARNLVQALDKPFTSVQDRSIAYLGDDNGWNYVHALGFADARIDAKAVVGLDPVATILALGRNEWGAMEGLNSALQNFVAKGGRILVLPQKAEEMANLNLPFRLNVEAVERARVPLQAAPILRGVGPQALHWRTFVKQDAISSAGLPPKCESLLGGLLVEIPQDGGLWLFSQLDWRPFAQKYWNFEKVQWNVCKYYRQLFTNLGARTDDLLANRLTTPEFWAPLVEVPLWKLSRATDKVDVPPQKGLFPGLASPMEIEKAMAKQQAGTSAEAADDIVIKDAVVGEGELNRPGLDLGKMGWATFGPRRSDSIVHMNWITSPEVGKRCYGRSWVYSGADRMASFAMGCDYWMIFKINGKAYIDHSRDVREQHAPFPGEFRFKAPLKKGWNLLEVKVASGSASFGFSCMVSDPGDTRFEGALNKPAEVKEAPKADLLPEPKDEEAKTFYIRPLLPVDDPYRFNPW